MNLVPENLKLPYHYEVITMQLRGRILFMKSRILLHIIIIIVVIVVIIYNIYTVFFHGHVTRHDMSLYIMGHGMLVYVMDPSVMDPILKNIYIHTKTPLCTRFSCWAASIRLFMHSFPIANIVNIPKNGGFS